MAIDSKNEVCNLTCSLLGNLGTVNDIDTPTNDKELVFALWYDVARQVTLKTLIPNFCLDRRTVAKLVYTPPWPDSYAYAYEYPVDCLKLLGLNNVDEKDYSYAVEGRKILSDDDVAGMPIRYIKDITDVTMFSVEFKIELAFELANYVVLALTQDKEKAKLMLSQMPDKRSILSALNAQENRPVRKNVSRFKQARNSYVPSNTSRK